MKIIKKQIIRWTSERWGTFAADLLRLRQAEPLTYVESCRRAMAMVPLAERKNVNAQNAFWLMKECRKIWEESRVEQDKLLASPKAANGSNLKGRYSHLATVPVVTPAKATLPVAQAPAPSVVTLVPKAPLIAGRAPIETELGLTAKVVRETQISTPAPVAQPALPAALATHPSLKHAMRPSLEQALRAVIVEEVKATISDQSLLKAEPQTSAQNRDSLLLQILEQQSQQITKLHMELASLKTWVMVLVEGWGLTEPKSQEPSAAAIPEVTPVRHDPQPAIHDHNRPARKKVMVFSKDHRLSESWLKGELPGVDVVLKKNLNQAEEGKYDLVVFDCAKAGHLDAETLQARFKDKFHRSANYKKAVEFVKNHQLSA